MTPNYLASFLISFGSTLLLTPVARRIALRLRLVDMPSARKMHTDPIPQMGGAAIILGFFVSVAFSGLVGQTQLSDYRRLAALFGGAVILVSMGFIDDLRVVPGWIKVPLELALGGAFYLAGLRAEVTGSWAINLITTIAWVIGVTNAVNYIDNMDGLTSGSVAIAAGYFAFLAGLSGKFLVAILSAALAGAALGFLWYNRPPARIFMGDIGSLFFGILLAGLGLDLEFPNLGGASFFVPVAILAVPVLDALMVSVSRVSRGLSAIHPGKDHISHRLVNLGLPPPAAVGVLWFAGAACGWIGVAIAYSPQSVAFMLMGWLIAVAAFVGLLLLTVTIDSAPGQAPVVSSGVVEKEPD